MRLRTLAALLVAAVAAAAFTRIPLLDVPAYEAGLATGFLACVLTCWLAVARARRRAPLARIRWGLLEQSPGEQVLAETGANLRAGALVVALPFALVASQAATSGCRVWPGVPTFLLMALPPVLAGAALGTLVGSFTRRRRWALVLLAGVAAVQLGAVAVEGWIGPRHVLHSLSLGPLWASAYGGYDAELDFPTSVAWHRLLALVAFPALLAVAAIVRGRVDAPAAPLADGGDGELSGWEASRSDDASRARFLLRHHRRGAAKLLVILGVLALPFLLMPDHAGLTSGRRRLARELAGTFETEHFRIHFQPQSETEGDLPRIAAELEFCWRQAVTWLEIAPDWKVEAWIHPDENSLFQLTGARGYVFAAPWNHELHVLRERGRGSLRHELIHVLAAEFGGFPLRTSTAPGLIEGLATALDEGHSRIPEAHSAIAAAAEAGLVPSAQALMSPLGFAAEGDMDRAYRSSASFVGFLLLRHGAGPIRHAYSWTDFDGAYGKDLATLDAEWRQWLRDDVPKPRAVAARAVERFDPKRRPALYRSPCPRVGRAAGLDPAGTARLLAGAGRHEDAAALYCEAWSLTAESAHLESAAVQLARSGDLGHALAVAELALSQAPPSRRDGALDRRVVLLGALGRWDEAAAALAERREADLASWPEEIDLEDAALADVAAREAYYAARAAGAAVRERMLALLAHRPDFAPGMHRALETAGWAPESRPLRQARAELALRFAAAEPAAPALAAHHLLDAADEAAEAGDWASAGRLHEAVLALGGAAGPTSPHARTVRAAQLLEAQDGLERAEFASALEPTLRRLLPPPQHPLGKCRRGREGRDPE